MDIRYFQDNTQRIIQSLKKRGSDVDLGKLQGLIGERANLQRDLDEHRSQLNRLSKEIGEFFKQGQREKAEDAKAMTTKLKGDMTSLEKRFSEVDVDVFQSLKEIPNSVHESVPEGSDESDNQELRTWGEASSPVDAPKTHDELGIALGLLDFAAASKITGSRFSVLKADLARLERALIAFMLDRQRENGYQEVSVPFLVNRDAMTGTGQLPKFEEDAFSVSDPDYFLIPTAEVPVTNLHREEMLEAGDLPLAYTAYTPCFRREAGTYGKDTKGLIRQHQFHKVELVQFVLPETSYDVLESLTAHASGILEALELPYRVVSLCGGDMGFSAAKTYDLEVWLPGQGAYREISSCSNFESFQAMRAGIRFKRDATSKPEFVHTLNGSGLAVGRTLLAVMENFQTERGEIAIPKVLQPYMGGQDLIKG